jgi:hypothetical protein
LKIPKGQLYWFIYLIFKLLSNLKMIKYRRHCHFKVVGPMKTCNCFLAPSQVIYVLRFDWLYIPDTIISFFY